MGTQKPEDSNAEDMLKKYLENEQKTQAIGLGKKKNNVDLGSLKLQRFLD